MAEEKDIQGLLQEQFATFEEEPERDLWPAIEAGLTPARKKRPLWFNWVAIAASITLLFGLIWFLQEDSARSLSQPLVETRPLDNVPQQEAGSLRTQPQQQAQVQLTEGLEEPGNLPSREPKASTEPLTPNLAQKPKVLPAAAIEGGQNPIAQPLLAEETPRVPLSPKKKGRDIRSIEQVVPWEETLIGSQEQLVMDSPLPKPVNTNLRAKRTAISPKNELDLSKLTLRDAIEFASRELSKVSRSPVHVKDEVGEADQLSSYQVKVLNLKFASNQQQIKAETNESNIESEDVVEEETVNSYQLDFFNLKIRKKTHKRVVTPSKS